MDSLASKTDHQTAANSSSSRACNFSSLPPISNAFASHCRASSTWQSAQQIQLLALRLLRLPLPRLRDLAERKPIQLL
ncbi:MAG: hypothetical protein ACKVJX_24195 [Verrucomicrobiia bacterium]|jgi:hypothetical protein